MNAIHANKINTTIHEQNFSKHVQSHRMGTGCFYKVLLLTTWAFLRALTLAKSCISFVLSIFFASLFSIDRIARSSSLCCDIVDLKYVFINFNFENDLSANATVTGTVMKSINSLYMSGKDELMRLWSMRLSTSKIASVTEISFLNLVAKTSSQNLIHL